MARIIVADDDTITRQIYTHILDDFGHDFVVCQNGAQALEAFKTAKADLLILDISMPVMDGLEACRQIRRRPDGIGVPIIIVSASNSEDDVSSGFSAGATDYMLKPIKKTILIAKLKNFLKIKSLHTREFQLVNNHVEFAGRYKIEKVIGYGAHSVVMLANDMSENRHVALKLLNENITDSATAAKYVELLARYQQLDPEYFIKIIDYGQESGQLFVVMELAGEDIKHSISHHKLSEPQLCRIAIELIESITALRDAGLVHLDIKPENIITHNGRFKLADFGMFTPRDTATIPLKTELWTTTAYASPESFEGKDELDHHSDIYSLGVVLFELATGDNPFTSDKATVAMFRHVNLTPPYISSIMPKISFEFSCLVADMMVKNPGHRPEPETLVAGFNAIRQCYENSELAKLTFVSADDLSSPFGTMDLLHRTSTNLQRMNVKMGRKISVIDKAGELGLALLYRNPKFTYRGNASWRKIAVAAIVFGIFFNLLGYFSFASLKYYPDNTDNLPVTVTRCSKCGNLSRREVKDIHAVSCDKCGGKCGFAMQCRACSKSFSWTQPQLPQGISSQAAKQLIDNSLKCPACGSTSTAYDNQTPGGTAK